MKFQTSDKGHKQKNMKYYKYIDSESEEERIVYNEFDNEYYCLRAIYEEQGKLVATNIVYEDYQYILPEGSMSDCIDMLGEEIDSTEFEKKWQQALSLYQKEWNIFKEKYIIGQNITTTINCFYPQGIILNIDHEKFHGIADYEKSKIHFGEEKMYPKEQLEMKIESFDHQNMWIVLAPGD